MKSETNVKSTADPYTLAVQTQLAQNNAITCLLNCYIREYALPHGQVCFDDKHLDAPLAFSLGMFSDKPKMRLHLPESNITLLLIVERVSLLGRVRFISQPYIKQMGRHWQPINAMVLAKFLLEHLSLVLDSPMNHELLDQIQNSINVTQAFLQRLPDDSELIHAETSLIDSEQSLVWGHAMHPAPKSRHGVSFDDMLACSPEIQANFALFWFRVSPSFIKQLHSSDALPLQVINQINPSSDCLYPCHPWEVNTIMAQPLIKRAIAQGLMEPIGCLGNKVYPTSSVRTTYLPEINQFMKFSIHVRLTNCVRKNAWYELESAVELTHLLKQVEAEAHFHCPKFALMAEPCASTLDLSRLVTEDMSSSEAAQACTDVEECFGILYRDGIAAPLLERYQPQMAGAIFAWDKQGESRCVRQVQALARQQKTHYSHMAAKWFAAYLDALLPGVLHYFFKQGVAFEPHLQNTVIGFTQGLPSFVWFRDLEGTKLIEKHWPAEQLTLSDDAKQSVYYSQAQGWDRIAYCTLINNVSEAIFHLADADRQLETKLWKILGKAIAQWQLIEGDQAELTAFLQGAAIPSKNNLTTRLLKQADKHSGYTLLTNPLASIE
ncbi:IucA/IucC family protein [Shewanella surugensis]|uniref:Siderophore biosynthesis protein PvsD n=1 Tax=Shewanella surugensis TaxID=212020 RepID=A0ABT0LCI6_9GAMM|nr:IucA/IucC family protein [Shewanella surugensis]MCL1125419.1 hypothetical protein [Shewanella surugensis]